MKNSLFPKIACGVMIGVFVPLGTVSAADENDRIQSHLGDGTSSYSRSAMDAPYQTHETWSAPQGAQGPIRSDMSSDKSLDSDKEAARQALDKQLFPLNPEGG
jgi:hypothetical protein